MTVEGHRQAPARAPAHRRPERRDALHQTPGFTAVGRLRPRAHAPRRPRRRGHAVRHAGLAGDRAAGAPAAHAPTRRPTRRAPPPTTTARPSTTSRSQYSPTEAVAERAGRADQRHRGPEPGRELATPAAARPADFPAATSGAISLVQRGTCGIAQQARQRPGGGRGRRDHVQRGRQRRAHRTRASAPARRTSTSPPCSRASRSARSSTTPTRPARSPTVRLETSGVNVEHFYPQVVAETRTGDPNHVVLAGAHLDSVPAGPGINDDGSGTVVAARARRAAREARTPPKQQDPLPVVRRRRGRPGRLAVLRRAPLARPRSTRST